MVSSCVSIDQGQLTTFRKNDGCGFPRRFLSFFVELHAIALHRCGRREWFQSSTWTPTPFHFLYVKIKTRLRPESPSVRRIIDHRSISRLIKPLRPLHISVIGGSSILSRPCQCSRYPIQRALISGVGGLDEMDFRAE